MLYAFDIREKLQSFEGVMDVLVRHPTHEAPRDGSLLRQAIDVARRTDLSTVSIVLGEIGLHNRKIIVHLWPQCHVAVLLISGHPANKSLQRTLRRLGRRYGGVTVESGSKLIVDQPCDTEPPAPSSEDQKTEPSYPSLVVETPSTGDSQEDK